MTVLVIVVVMMLIGIAIVITESIRFARSTMSLKELIKINKA